MLLTQLLATAFVIVGTGLMIGTTILYAYIVINWKDFNRKDYRDVNKLSLITLVAVVFVAVIFIVVEYSKHLIS